MSRESWERSEQSFWEQFDNREPDLPQTTPTTDYRKLDLWKEYGKR